MSPLTWSWATRQSLIPALRSQFIAAAKAAPGVQNVSVNITSKVTAHAVQRNVQLLPGVKNIVAVASGKGGVGKHHRRQPGAGAGGRGSQGGRAGRRHLRPQPAHDAGHQRPPRL